MPDELTYNKCKKKGYSTRKRAKKMLKNLNQYKGMKLKSIYLCEICGVFHLTKKNKVESRRYTRFLHNKKER